MPIAPQFTANAKWSVGLRTFTMYSYSNSSFVARPKEIPFNLTNDAKLPCCSGEGWTVFHSMIYVERYLVNFVLPNTPSSNNQLTNLNSSQCNFFIWCFFDEQHSCYYKLLVFRSFTGKTRIFQRCIQSIFDGIAFTSEAILILKCYACRFLTVRSDSLFRLFLKTKGILRNLVMSKINKDESRSLEYQENRDKRLPGKEKRQKNGLAELREMDDRLAGYYRRTRLKELLVREFSGTPRTLFLIITFPFWFSWALIKDAKKSFRKKTN